MEDEPTPIPTHFMLRVLAPPVQMRRQLPVARPSPPPKPTTAESPPAQHLSAVIRTIANAVRTGGTPQRTAASASQDDEYSVRFGHALVALLRVLRSTEAGSASHRAIVEAASSVTQSVSIGLFGGAGEHLRAAHSSMKGSAASQVADVERYVSDANAPVQCNGTAGSVGAQALAGLICARLLRSLSHRTNCLPNQVTLLGYGAEQALAGTLIDQLTTCSSKDQIRQTLLDFISRFSMGTVRLPTGRVTLLDEVDRALIEVGRFNVERVGMQLKMRRFVNTVPDPGTRVVNLYAQSRDGSAHGLVFHV